MLKKEGWVIRGTIGSCPQVPVILKSVSDPMLCAILSNCVFYQYLMQLSEYKYKLKFALGIIQSRRSGSAIVLLLVTRYFPDLRDKSFSSPTNSRKLPYNRDDMCITATMNKLRHHVYQCNDVKYSLSGDFKRKVNYESRMKNSG
jgi:hypothetical protein